MPKQPNTRASKVIKNDRTARADRAARRALTRDGLELLQRFEKAKALAKVKSARSTQVTGAAASQAAAQVTGAAASQAAAQVTGAAASQAAAQVTGAAASQAAAQVAATAATQDPLLQAMQAILRGQRQLAAKLDEMDERASKQRATLRAMLGDDDAGRTDTAAQVTGAAAPLAAAQVTGAAAPLAAAQVTGAAASLAAAQVTTSHDSPPVLTEQVMQQLNDLSVTLRGMGSGNDTTFDQHLAKVENIVAEIAKIARDHPLHMNFFEECVSRDLHTMWRQLNHGIVFYGDKSTENSKHEHEQLEDHRAKCLANRDYTDLEEVHHYTDRMDAERIGFYRYCRKLQAAARAYNAKIFAVLHEVLDNTSGKGLLTINGHMCKDHQTLEFLISRSEPSHGLMLAWCEAWPDDRRAAMKKKIHDDMRRLYGAN